jgi:hypothetical protein
MIKGEKQEMDRIYFQVDGDGFLCFRGRYCVAKQEDIRREVLIEAHRSKFSMHPGEMKMYQDMRQQFWWIGMKKDIV